MGKTTIRVDEENLARLHKIRGEIEAKTGKFTRLDEALEYLLNDYKKHHK